MKNAKKVSYKEVLAQKNYDFMVSEGARFCDARDVKNYILDNYTPEEAILKVAEQLIWEDFLASIQFHEKWLSYTTETIHFIQNFILDEGMDLLKKRLKDMGCPDLFFNVLTEWGYEFSLDMWNLHGCSVKTAIERIRDYGISETKTHSVGGGEWSLEVYDEDGDFSFEFVGSNGTRSESDDLGHELDILIALSELKEEHLKLYLNK